MISDYDGSEGMPFFNSGSFIVIYLIGDPYQTVKSSTRKDNALDMEEYFYQFLASTPTKDMRAPVKLPSLRNRSLH
jgi:hypothetical protein